jgi:hypothetical protein
MSHLYRANQALTDVGYKLSPYIDNEHVIGLDIMQPTEVNGAEVLTPIGHAVFAPSKRKNELEFVFVEGRVGQHRIAAVGKTPARALREFEKYLTELAFA